MLTPQSVLLSLHDRAQQVTISDDRLTLTGFKFYCTVRANLFVSRGTWYFENKILDMKEGAATRIGWAQRYANLQVQFPCNESLALWQVLHLIDFRPRSALTSLATR